jgi:hypothetical protein
MEMGLVSYAQWNRCTVMPSSAILLVTLAGAALLTLGGGASQPARNSDPWLELPQAAQRVEVDGAARARPARPAPSSSWSSAFRPADPAINYGSIHTKVNTESADVAMKSTSGLDGFT